MAAGYQVRRGQLTHQEIDGEVIIVNLETGMYYSLRGAAVPMWSAMEQAATQADLLAIFHDAIADHRDKIAECLNWLIREALIEASDASPRQLPRVPYSEPLMEAHSDMEALLLADPIHYADEQGWPSLATGQADKPLP